MKCKLSGNNGTSIWCTVKQYIRYSIWNVTSCKRLDILMHWWGPCCVNIRVTKIFTQTRDFFNTLIPDCVLLVLVPSVDRRFQSRLTQRKFEVAKGVICRHKSKNRLQWLKQNKRRKDKQWFTKLNTEN
jgi:hypothetical protein